MKMVDKEKLLSCIQLDNTCSKAVEKEESRKNMKEDQGLWKLEDAKELLKGEMKGWRS